jgi:hypothetical protein
MKEWTPEDESCDNNIIILISIEENKAHVEVGKGVL